MKATEIQWRYENGRKLAAMKVKGYSFPKAYDISEHFNIDDDLAQTLVEKSWDCLANSFWEYRVRGIIELVFGDREWCSAGHSSGWLCVEIDPTSFTDVRKWSRFVKYVDEEIKFMSTKENVCDFIKDNNLVETCK